MFVSAGLCIKLHHWPDPEGDLEYIPSSGVGVKQISLCNDNSYLAYLLENNRAQIISLRDKSNIHLVHTITSVKDVSAVCFKHFTKRNLALGTLHGDVLIYDTKLRSEIRRFTKLASPVNVLEFTYDDKQIGVCSENSVVVYSNSDNEIKDEFVQVAQCTVMKFHPSVSNHFAVGCKNGNVSLWDIGAAAKLLNFSEHMAPITGLAVSKTSNVLVTTGLDYKINILNSGNAETIFRMNLQQPVTSLDMSKDDKVIAAGLDDGTVYLYDLRRPCLPLSQLKPYNSAVTNIHFQNGNKELCLNGLEAVPDISTVPLDDYGIDTYIRQYVPQQQSVKNLDEDPEKSQALDRIRNEIFKLVKSEMDDLENQLDEHCLKFQAFLNNEFDIIENHIKSKWDIFNLSKIDDDQNSAVMSCANK